MSDLGASRMITLTLIINYFQNIRTTKCEHTLSCVPPYTFIFPKKLKNQEPAKFVP